MAEEKDVGVVEVDLLRLILDGVKETGVNLKISAAALALYTTERAAALSLAIGQPGFEEAVRAERDNVALKGGISAVLQGDAADARFVGLIQGALGLAARAIAGI